MKKILFTLLILILNASASEKSDFQRSLEFVFGDDFKQELGENYTVSYNAEGVIIKSNLKYVTLAFGNLSPSLAAKLPKNRFTDKLGDYKPFYKNTDSKPEKFIAKLQLVKLSKEAYQELMGKKIKYMMLSLNTKSIRENERFLTLAREIKLPRFYFAEYYVELNDPTYSVYPYSVHKEMKRVYSMISDYLVKSEFYRF